MRERVQEPHPLVVRARIVRGGPPLERIRVRLTLDRRGELAAVQHGVRALHIGTHFHGVRGRLQVEGQRCRDARAVALAEPDPQRRAAIVLLKQLEDDDRLRARFFHAHDRVERHREQSRRLETEHRRQARVCLVGAFGVVRSLQRLPDHAQICQVERARAFFVQPRENALRGSRPVELRLAHVQRHPWRLPARRVAWRRRWNAAKGRRRCNCGL